jgi:hypothetical protein
MNSWGVLGVVLIISFLINSLSTFIILRAICWWSARKYKNPSSAERGQKC